jgi:AraC-like DNA-binding protein
MIGAKVWTLTTSLGLWIPAGLRHSGWAAAGVVLRAAQFSVRSSPVLAEGAVAIEFTALLRLLLDRLDGELADGERARTEAVVIDVLRPAEHGFLLRMPRSPLLARIVEAITADPADRTGLEQWSARLGVSSRTITRTFRAETGLGFERWVAAARIRHAIVLLSQGEMVEDVAESVGYRSATAFGAAFRRITGVTPGAVRAD